MKNHLKAKIHPFAKKSKEQNVIYVGNKPPMNYVMAVITDFNMSDSTEVTLKARGRAISTALMSPKSAIIDSSKTPK